MLQERRYKVVDVFTATPMLGNPLAVVIDADGLDTETMQRIAHWTNLSETTFLLPATDPDADYRLRIFTPLAELPFAGHPTLGSAYAGLEVERLIPRDNRLVQECGVGLVELAVDRDGGKQNLSFRLPPATVTTLGEDDVAELEEILGQSVERNTPPAMVDVGPVWIVAQIKDVRTLLSLEPDFVRCALLERRLGATGVTVFAASDSGQADVEVRSFAPSSSINEDPVCGSGNGSVAVFRRERGLLPPGTSYTATQGQCVRRGGSVSVTIDDGGNIALGGDCVTCVDGTLRC